MCPLPPFEILKHAVGYAVLDAQQGFRTADSLHSKISHAETRRLEGNTSKTSLRSIYIYILTWISLSLSSGLLFVTILLHKHGKDANV
jgi:hypothetical protein